MYINKPGGSDIWPQSLWQLRQEHCKSKANLDNLDFFSKHRSGAQFNVELLDCMCETLVSVHSMSNRKMKRKRGQGEGDREGKRKKEGRENEIFHR